jgi:hypothetical protein
MDFSMAFTMGFMLEGLDSNSLPCVCFESEGIRNMSIFPWNPTTPAYG